MIQIFSKLAPRLEQVGRGIVETKMAKPALRAILPAVALISSLGLSTSCTRSESRGAGCTAQGCWENIGNDIRITNDPHMSELPSLVWAGSEYGLSWQDDRDGNWEIYFARLSNAGIRLGPDIRITNDAQDSWYPFQVWTGSEYGLSWQDDRDGNWEIYFVRLSAGGAKLGADVRITNDPHDSWYPSVIWTGSQYGVSWDDSREGNNEIYFAVISAGGAKLGHDIRIMSDPQTNESFSLAWTGFEYGVNWNDWRHRGWEINFFLRSASGTKIRIASNPNRSRFPALAWTGSEYGVSWDDWRENNDEIYFARFGLVP